MAAKKVSSKHQKDLYAGYKAARRWETNRKAKLERHLKKFPNDEVAAKAVGNIKYRRKTPNKDVWTRPTRELAHMYRLAGLNGNSVL